MNTAAPGIMTVTLSPALDLTITSDVLEPGTSHRVPPAVGRLGGKGINVARVLTEIGRPVYVLGPVAPEEWPDRDRVSGSPDGSAAGQIWDLTATPSRLRRSYAIVEDSGRATVLNERTRPHPAEVWAELEASILRRLAEPNVGVLVISGSTPSDLPAGFYERVVSAARLCQVRVIVDTSGPALLTAARAGADWVKPNREELAELVIDEIHDDEPAVVDAGARLLIEAGAGSVLVSCGSEGMILTDGSGPRMRARPGSPLRGNPTGAGDASVAALARWLADADECADGEIRTGHVTAGDHSPRGAGPPSDDDVRALLTDAVALSASAVLMPQAGQIHTDWRDLREGIILEPLDRPFPAETSPTTRRE
ncbi:1-phosphofructokinase family hexose kinase [Brevibacterium renqingii]|uniref:1-phosphofructokinase family hexose kinase n=1 Tax=Brevibacterium renqingii TaxID=2776916 RepID=UPI001ADF38F7|nr:PfkB family carbohydrate kinase [Brevibacterium renqingii]